MQVTATKPQRKPRRIEPPVVAGVSPSDIWARLVNRKGVELSDRLARLVSELDFAESDHQRMHELNTKVNEGLLSSAERTELETYIQISDLLTVLQCQARRSLRNHGSRA